MMGEVVQDPDRPSLHYQITRRYSKFESKHLNNIRRHRIQAQLSQRQLADRLGRRKGAISMWERGLCCPTKAVVVKLAKQLDTTVEKLYLGEANGTP